MSCEKLRLSTVSLNSLSLSENGLNEKLNSKNDKLSFEDQLKLAISDSSLDNGNDTTDNSKIPLTSSNPSIPVKQKISKIVSNKLHKITVRNFSQNHKNNGFNNTSSSNHLPFNNVMNLNEWVSLNVGGRIFTTTKMTLVSQEPDSMLARMFDSDWNHCRDGAGAILIDRSPEYFEIVLNYLRTGEVVVNDGVNLRGVLLEARYYGLSQMLDKITEMTKNKKEENNVDDDKEDVPFTRREFLKLIIGTQCNSELRCQGINLEGRDLSKLDLRQINFKFANLKGCNLTYTNLSNCNFERADLSYSKLDHSTIVGCYMMCANLEHASMRDCNLFNDEAPTCLQGAHMKQVDLEGSRLANVNLRVANLKNSNLQNCDLRGVVFAGADLENCNLTGCDLEHANLRGANLEGVAFELILNPLHMSQAVR